MAIKKLESYNELKQLLMLGRQTVCFGAVSAQATRYPFSKKGIGETQLGWAELGLEQYKEQYKPLNVIELYVHVEVKETESDERIEELERTVKRLTKQLRDVRENLVVMPQASYPGLSREERRKRLDVLFERAMEEAVGIEERYGDPVELLTTLLPLSEEEARKLERE